MRQKTKDLKKGWRGEAARAFERGTETLKNSQNTEPLVLHLGRVMEAVCSRENCLRALKRVRSNKGSPGIDGMNVYELAPYLKENWERIRQELFEGRYRPQPVKRVEIPKPDGGVRKLGIPTVLDRFIQQALLQVLQPMWEGTFSDNSYGFRPQRSAHQAVMKAKGYVSFGYETVVDIDLEKFFDRVNHDRLMAKLVKRIPDRRVCILINRYLKAGVLEGGLISATREGTPQGGPLSPLLSNIVLDELDKELESRNHRFVRYADDCNIYVKTPRAGQRVMKSITAFITSKLKLQVNSSKSAVAQVAERTFLGFSLFRRKTEVQIGIAPKALERFRKRIRETASARKGRSVEQLIEELNNYLRGWGNYYSIATTRSTLRAQDSWIRRRLRSIYWKQWKRGTTRFRELRARGVSRDVAAITAGASCGPWRISGSPGMHSALSLTYFRNLGLLSLEHDAG